MRAKLLLAGALAVLPGFFGHAQEQPHGSRWPCLNPVPYRIGTLDPRFGISRAEFARAVGEAQAVWNAAAGRQLFSPSARAPLQIDLVYDSRQEMTQRVAAARTSISEKLKAMDAVTARLLPMRDQFHALDAAYGEQVASYNQRQELYNRTVEQSNGRGGASAEEFRRLNKERRDLQKEEALLEARKQELDRLADDVNLLVRRHNMLLHQANAEADAFNQSNISGFQFEEGRYTRFNRQERIEIYQYDGETGLRIILAHELGHALGIPHNGNASSIMSPLIHTDRLALTADDVEGLKAACMLDRGPPAR